MAMKCRPAWITIALVASIWGCTEAKPPLTGPAPPGNSLRVQGRLTAEGVECPALRGDDGRLYTLTGDLKGFSIGDRVLVEGTLAQISFCMQGTTLQVRSISRLP
jgi:hypothetical protein